MTALATAEALSEIDTTQTVFQNDTHELAFQSVTLKQLPSAFRAAVIARGMRTSSDRMTNVFDRKAKKIVSDNKDVDLSSGIFQTSFVIAEAFEAFKTVFDRTDPSDRKGFYNGCVPLVVDRYYEFKANSRFRRVERVKAYFEAVMYALLQFYVSTGENINEDYHIIKMRISSQTVKDEDWYRAQLYYQQSFHYSEKRGPMTNIVGSCEIFDNLVEWTKATHATQRIESVDVDFGNDIGTVNFIVLEMCDPKLLHGKNRDNCKSMLERAELFNQTRADQVKEFSDKILERLYKRNGTEQGKTFGFDPYNGMRTHLNDVLNGFVDVLCEHSSQTNIDNFARRMLYTASVERALIGYYAWMVIYGQIQSSYTTNTLERAMKDHLYLGIDPKQLEEVIVYNFERYTKLHGRSCPVPLMKFGSDLEIDERIMFQPIAIREATEAGIHQWKLSETLSASILTRVKLNEEQTEAVDIISQRPFSIAWVYAKTDQDFAELLQRKGKIPIDGKRYFLLVYNPNGEIKQSRCSHARGCWMITVQKKDGTLKFVVLTRSKFHNEFEANRVNISFDYPQMLTDEYGNEHYRSVHFSYCTYRLPPTMAFKYREGGGYDRFNMPNSRVCPKIDDWAIELMNKPGEKRLSDLTINLVSSVMKLGKG